MEILSEKFKRIVLEKNEFENRQSKNTNSTFPQTQPINIPI